MLTDSLQQDVTDKGFGIINSVYTPDEVEAIIAAIENADTDKDTFRKSTDLFAIRQFLKEVPSVMPLVFNSHLNRVISEVFGNDYFIVKSIYFDKPPASNWYVSYHQDLTISVNQKHDTEGFASWTNKQNQYAVQPPLKYLQNVFTLRIHLDDTDDLNGALKVIHGSHNKGIYRPETIDWFTEQETICNVAKGGVMIMKPLLLHSSDRTVNDNRRRVIHIELASLPLPESLQWSEYNAIF